MGVVALPSLTDCAHNLITLPGGEVHITGKPPQKNDRCVLMLRGASAEDILKMCLWADAIHRDKAIPYLVIPYLPAARQDRRHPGEALSAKIYADIINSCKFEEVFCFDPHSDVMPALIERCNVTTVKEFLSWAMSNNPWGKWFKARWNGIIAPDAGANKRAQSIADLLSLPLYQGTKIRDVNTGKLKGFRCDNLEDDRSYLIVDDICDGGGTFVGLIEEINKNNRLISFGLYVSHGVFSPGWERLLNLVDEIIVSNSHPGMDKINTGPVPGKMAEIHVLNIDTFLLGKAKRSF
jgi:ribose-phosphate pyrophosphokinase